MIELNEKTTFDEAYAALEETVAALEASDAGFEKSVELYEQASKLMGFCYSKMNEAKLKITTIDEYIAGLRSDVQPIIEED